MAKYAAKKDANHDAVLDGPRRLGCVVVDTFRVGSNGVPGFPDAIVYDPYSATVWFVEIKDVGGKLTEKEREFWVAHEGLPLVIWRTVEEALDEVMQARGVLVDESTNTTEG
jgi:hypothetical protein